MYVNNVTVDIAEIEFSAIRAQGAGGQNVNKVSSAIHLRFDIDRSSLPDDVKKQLKNVNDKRISRDGVIVIKAQKFRTQEKNKEDAMARLYTLIRQACHKPKTRIPSRISRAAKQRRTDSKVHRGRVKLNRSKVKDLW